MLTDARRPLLRFAAVLLAAPVFAADAVPPRTHPDTAGWSAVFSPDLSNAEFKSGVWSSTDGVLTATEDQALWTKKVYEDFILDLEFKNAKGTNSGVIVHCSDLQDWIPNSVEIQIADDSSAKPGQRPTTMQCGAIFGHVAPTTLAVRAPGEWNRFTITCIGPRIHVMLNGARVCAMDMTQWTSATKNPDGTDIPPWLSKAKATLPLKGHIGFQGKHAGAPVWFRNIRIKELKQ